MCNRTRVCDAVAASGTHVCDTVAASGTHVCDTVAMNATEDATTEEWMLKHGAYNVRGEMYAQVYLPDHVVEILETKFRHATGKNLSCGSRALLQRMSNGMSAVWP